ncbi:hypothetical protein ACWDZ8_45365 [Streptomyces sp. NPDC003233]|uniref:hypothetical protein n=1 Tax=Streptomyces sp. NPDC007856 TaxID=3364781 RepID=UPI0036C2EC85
MAEQTKEEVGPGEEAGRSVFLPDLTGVDLRTLRAMDDPGLTALVDEVLASAQRCGEVWYTGGDYSPVEPGPPGRSFPATRTELVRGEERPG